MDKEHTAFFWRHTSGMHPAKTSLDLFVGFGPKSKFIVRFHDSPR